MKKLLLLLSIFITAHASAQVLFYDDLSVDLSADYTMIDDDGRTVDPFLTNQGVFVDGTWEIVNFGTPLGVAYYSSSRFTGADSCMSTSDWMVLPMLDFTAATSNPFVTFKAGSNFGNGEITVFATNAIAGTDPVVSDFTTPALSTFTLSNVYQDFTVDLSAFSGDATVYISIVNSSVLCDGIIAAKDIKVKNTAAVDMQLNTFSLITDDANNSELAFNYSVADCGAAMTPVTLDIENLGNTAMNDTVYVGYAYADNTGNVIIEDTILDFITTPLASGSVHTHTYTMDVDLSLLEVSVFTAYVFAENDGDTLNDLNTHIIVAPNTYDLATQSYTNSFEFDFGSDEVLANTLAVKFENNATSTEWTAEDFSVFGNSNEFLSDGDFVLQHGYIGTPPAFPASDNWFFTPCLTFDATKVYRVSFDYNTFSGDLAPHNMDFALTSDYSSASVVETVITGESLGDTVLTNFTKAFQVTTSGDYHFGVHDNSPVGFFLTMDLLTIEELPAPNVPTLSNTWDPCTEEATVSFSFINGNDYTMDWGDGSALETLTSSPATHTYTPGGTFTATLNVSNLAGANSGTTTIDAMILGTPDADFTYSQSGTSDASVSFTVSNPLPCNTYNWTFGDGNIGTGSSVTNTYVAAGTFTVTLTATNSTGTNTSSQDIIFTVGIEDVDFANGINIFPNPATESLNVSFELNSLQDIEMNLVSIDGKVVRASKEMNTNNVNNTFNLSGLSSGIYVLDITTTEGKYTRNIMVK